MRKYNNGFSLVEVLAVVILIAVLAILAMGAIGSLKRKLETGVCTANLRQVGVALFAYVADNNGQIMAPYSEDVKSPRAWPRRLITAGYIANPDILFCPSFFPRNNKEAKRKPAEKDATDTYGLRAWVPPGVTWKLANHRMHHPFKTIQNPADFFIVADSLWTADGWHSQGYSLAPDPKNEANNKFIHLRHAGKANALFADGHVESKEATYFTTLHETQGAYSGGRAWSVSEQYLKEGRPIE
ncbi:MAG TPA: prepilin-type N-terminal cleavage/methylation domain-containing protein [Chthoniobacteraceae bacterium]|nr:prepilin-type N-terminal cleavage/methylation domain-containing protein [Chthoniobacteraceae bacterium]